MHAKSHQLDLANAQSIKPHSCWDFGIRPIKALTYDYFGRLWFMSMDGRTFYYQRGFDSPKQLFHDHHGEAFCFDGDVGFLGTDNGDLLSFDVNNPRLRRVTPTLDSNVAVSITTDPRQKHVFFSTIYNIFAFSYAGHRLGAWKCKIPPYQIRFAEHSGRIWSVSDGVELIDFQHRQSSVFGQGSLCGYVGTSEAPDGTVACFGANIDIYLPNKERLLSFERIDGGFNGGAFAGQNHLVGRVVEKVRTPTVELVRTQSAGFTIDFIRSCERVVVSPSHDEAAAFRDGKLFLFSLK